MKKQSGFSLTELLVVVSIIATLAAIGVPAYQVSQKKSRRAEAVAMLSTCYSLQMTVFAESDRFSYLYKEGGTPLIDQMGTNFPTTINGGDIMTQYWYDYGVSAEGSYSGAVDESWLNYFNYIDATGLAISAFGDDDNFITADPGSAAGGFRCIAIGNIDGDAATDVIDVLHSRAKATVQIDDITN